MNTSAPIATRPRYSTLEPRPCSAALMIADDAGMPALDALIRLAPDLGRKATILREEELDAIDGFIADARMGLHVWIAGAEGFIAHAQTLLLAAGVSKGAIQAEHRGSIARRMQCVHCKTLAEGVITDPYICPGCGRSLYVRDHFSRRLGAFQGVAIDAETPGVIPEPQDIIS